MSRKITLTLLTVCCLLGTALSQGNDIQFRLYNFEDGLSHRNVFKIQQDNYGFIWMATYNGLNRFDGRTFLKFKSRNANGSSADQFTPDIAVAPDTNLWIGKNTQLIRLQLTDRSEQKMGLTTEEASGSKSPSGLQTDARGGLWYYANDTKTGQSAIYHKNENDAPKHVYDCAGTFSSRAILPLDRSLLISGADHDVLQLDREGRPLKSYPCESPFSEDQKAWITQLAQSPDSTIWALFNNGLVFFMPPGQDTFQIHPITKIVYNTSNFSALMVEANGNVWLGGIGALWFYEQFTGKTVNFDAQVNKLTENNTTYRQIMKDRSGVIWIASDYGAVRAVRSEKLFTSYLSEGNENCSNGYCSMRGMAEGPDGLVYLSYYNSIHVLDPKQDMVRPLFPQNDFFNFPFGLVVHDDHLYTGNGKQIHLPTLKVDTLFDVETADKGHVVLGKDGVIWYGYENRLLRYNSDNNQLTPWSDPDSQMAKVEEINYLHFSPNDGKLWACTNANGLFKIDPTGGVVSQYTDERGSSTLISDKRVIAAYEFADGDLWLATANGVTRLDTKNGKSKIYTTDDGLPNNFINGLLPEGDSCIWFSTDNGLSRLSIRNERFKNFFRQDGLSKNEFNRVSFLRASDGRLYFGGLNGVNAFYPSDRLLQRETAFENEMLFCAFSKLEGSSDSIIYEDIGFHGDHPIQLGYNDKFFTFEFALANYVNPLEHLYSYQLEGYENEWSEPSPVNQARYSRVNAGDYIFRVRSSKGKGGWNPMELAINVRVEEAFYKKPWFLGLAGLALISMIYGYSQLRIYQIRKRQKDLESQVRERTIELEKEKQKSDELLLNILPLETAEELKKYGKAIAKKYESVTVLFTDFEDFSSIASKLDPVELVAHIDHCFKAFDNIIEKYGLEKIKTIGDAYMCVGGIPRHKEDSTIRVVQAALEIQEFMKNLSAKGSSQNGSVFKARIGMHTGPVVGGVVGFKKFAFDIWGDTVNIASRMETYGEVHRVNISQTTYDLVKNQVAVSPRGNIRVRGLGEIAMYFVDGIITNQQTS